MLNRIKRLVKGEPLQDDRGQLLYLLGVVLGSKNEDINQGTDYDVDEFMELQEWDNPLSARLKEQEAIIARLQESLAKANKPNDKKKYTQLNKDEVREIEMIFEKDFNTCATAICNAYSSSQPVISRIRNGIHAKSSEKYKAMILKRNLDEQR